MYIECTKCKKGIISEADPYVYHHTYKGDVFLHLDCYFKHQKDKLLDRVLEIFRTSNVHCYSRDERFIKEIEKLKKGE